MTEKDKTLTIGVPISTRMACSKGRMTLEKRFLNQLRGVTGYGFATGQLILSYRTSDASGDMRFDPSPAR